MSRWMVFDGVRQDLQYAWRTLGTAIISLLNAVELRRLPVRDPQDLVMLE